MDAAREERVRVAPRLVAQHPILSLVGPVHAALVGGLGPRPAP